MRKALRTWMIGLLFLGYHLQEAQAQMGEPDSVLNKNEKKVQFMFRRGKPPLDTTYANVASGEFTPGKGFDLVKSKFGSLNLSMYGMARWLDQMPGNQTWSDHLDSVRSFKGRNDIFWHRAMIWFSGFLGTPKLTYMITVWTVMTTQQTLVYGNIQYKINDHLRLGAGIYPNLCNRTLQGPFPFFFSTDRTMAEDALRGGFTNGFFVYGIIVPRLNYTFFIGNNLSTLGIQASKLTRDMSVSGDLVCTPTTGEFGPRGGNMDFEWHKRVATRFGVSYCHSREDRFNNIGTPSPDNTQVRNSDGVLLFETGALATGVTVQKADFDYLAVDAGMKYSGLHLQAEFFWRQLSKFETDGEVPEATIIDKAFWFAASQMAIPRILCVYGITSVFFDQWKRHPWEAGGGVNIYPLKTRNWRLNVQCLYVYKSAAGGTFGLYTAGQTGTTVTIGSDILL
ncbi:MAG TPA: hypothetical protein VMC08_00350 [Bacteroidales bacterium]|nr:hypothetical protein [Bacteroidales bacterium]